MTIYRVFSSFFLGFPSFRHNNVVNFGAKVIILLSKYTKGKEYSIMKTHVLYLVNFVKIFFELVL